MLAWLKQKPRLAPRGQYPPEIVEAIHTMADDISGETTPSKKRAQAEPLVAFQPGQGDNASFYAAPEIQKASIETVPSTPSPFLDMTGPETAPDAVDIPGAVAGEGENIEPAPSELSEVVPTRLADEEYITPDAESEPSKFLRWWQTSKKWVIFGTGIIALLSGSATAWWYWQKTHIPVTPPVVGTGEVGAQPPEITIEAMPSGNQGADEHYTPSQPNLLSFDTESVTKEVIATEFLKIARSIEQDGLREPVEFLVRDQNYNPLAFARFAYLFQLDLPSELLNTLDEDFSLYFYLDQDRPRIGLAVRIKDKEAFLVTNKANEAALPRVLSPLFLDTTTAPRTGLSFRSSLYQEQPIRYVNVDRDMNLSIDYAVREQMWLIGTSQNTLRVMLDQPKVTP